MKTEEEIIVGKKVWYHPIIGGKDRKPSTIVSNPWEVCGEMCCLIEGVSGCVSIKALEERV